MLRVTMDNIDQKRTIRPLYAQHQATPYGGFLDPNWARTVDIYPGMVMTRVTSEVFSLYQGTGIDTDQRPFGLSALFVAPILGIDEVRPTGTNLFTVWTGGPDAVFEILAPAFDTSAAWANPTDGRRILLGVTNNAHAQGPGKLSPIGTANVDSHIVGTLIDFAGPTKILVSLDRMPQTALTP